MSGPQLIKKATSIQEKKCDILPSDDMREFMQVVYRALMMVTRYLEKRYEF